MKVLSSVLLLCMLALAAYAYSTEIPSDILKSRYDGRTGDILIHRKDSNKIMGSVSFVNSAKFPAKVSEIQETEVADIITHANGLSPFQANRDRSNFPTTNFFSKPKANVFFYVQNPSTFQLASLPNSQTFPLSREAYYSANSTLPQLTSLFSGVTPDTHGIISDKFVNRVAGYPSSSISYAYDTWTQGVSYSANVADLWTLNSQGKALVMSFANSEQVSSALNAKPVIVDHQVRGNYGFYLNADAIETIYDDINKVNINKESIKTFYGNVAPCGLSFDDVIDYKLLAEITIPQLLVKSLNVPGSEFSKYTTDNIPDLFSFGFTSLHRFALKHGIDSTQMQCAITQLDQSISTVLSTLSSIYTANILAEIATVHLDTKIEVEPFAVVKEQLKNLVEVNSTVRQLMPNVYINEHMEESKVDAWVEKLNKGMEGKGYEAVKMPETRFESGWEAYRLVQNRRADGNETNNGTVGPDVENINEVVFQTCLWTGIGLGVAALAAWYMMFTVDAAGDPELYKYDINHPTSKSF